MDHKDASMADNAIDWSDPVFGNTQFDDAMPADSPFGASNSAFDAYTNMNDFIESPGGLNMRKASRTTLDFGSTPSHHMHMLANRSAESSSQDSASDTSSSRKRKTTSESPASDTPHDGNDKSRLVKQGDTLVDRTERRKIQGRSHQMDTAHRHNLSGGHALFDFNSASSSPINPNAFDAALSLDEQVNGMMLPPQGFLQQSPLQTINPATFTMAGSRDQSPANAMLYNGASPHAMFSTPSSDANNEAFATQGWQVPQGTAWANDFNSAAHFSPTGGLNFTPSPTSGGLTMATQRKSSVRPGKCRLHIAPISAKSRVETQISIIMTLETPPPGVEYLHLPLQTIAKSKLLAKEEVDPGKVLELHTMLVCTSAMRNAQLKSKALRRAAAQNNLEIQQRAEAQRTTGDEEKNDPKNVAEEDKPNNGGEVRICNNCIQRERKRAARKKLKKEEEQQHWERYETERVVVFNSNELLPFKAWEATQVPQKDTIQEEYVAPDGAIQVSAAMRIACYCRHQNEKEGFQVIFTMKDAEGNVVAQEMSDSILITDDHKTHPPSFPTQMSDQVVFGNNGNFPGHGLQTSYSMVDMSQHSQPGFTSSKSAGNLQTLAYGGQFGHGNMHQMQGSYSQATSASATPTNSLSRPGSPTSAGNSGPNKKRKSSSFHRKVPSGLTMTPRVDTGIPPQPNQAPSAVSMMSQFSPTTPGGTFTDQSYMNLAPGPQYINSGPPTPSENLHYASQQLAQGNHSRSNTQQVPDYYQSLPGSRVTSRAPSPVLQTSRPNMAAYARQQSGQTSNARQMFPQAMPQQPTETDSSALPMIHKITPQEGPIAGGTEVSIYGRDFAQGMQVYFGDQPATAITFYGEQALLCTSPPGRVGGVQVTVLPSGHLPQYTPSQTTRPVFTYKNANEKVMEMALRFVSQQQTGNSGGWWHLTQQNATRWMQQSINRSAGYNGGYDGGNTLSQDPTQSQIVVSRVIEAFDDCEVVDSSVLDAAFTSGETPLTVAAAAGHEDLVKMLLVRGANPDGRDLNGLTPLMHAAMHNKTKIFQSLVSRGADPTIRSLVGYTALEVATPDTLPTLQQILWSTPRSRMAPQFKTQASSGSFASSRTSWDISSASMYESDDWRSSRPSSTKGVQTATPQESRPNEDDTSDQPDSTTVKAHPLPAAMMAMRDTLALQVQHFSQTLQKSIVQLQFAIRPLPGLDDDHQENALVRRLATLMHTLNETFPYLPTAPLEAVLPPAYSDLYPEKMHGINAPSSFRKLSLRRSRKRSEMDSSVMAALRAREAMLLPQLIFWLCGPLLMMLSSIIVLVLSNGKGIRGLTVYEATHLVEVISHL